ncbi:MAG: lmo0937 family membrane protein [Fimbriimonadaceae bacterium]
MLWTLVATLMVLWLVGMISGAFGGILHVLLILALVVIVLSALQGRRAI